jgi:hypothetical protein
MRPTYVTPQTWAVSNGDDAHLPETVGYGSEPHRAVVAFHIPGWDDSQRFPVLHRLLHFVKWYVGTEHEQLCFVRRVVVTVDVVH